MTVLTVALAHNESRLIRHFVQHYRRLGDVTIYDDNSTDDTVAVATACGATVVPAGERQPHELEHRLCWVKNYSWQPVRDQYDWVIAVDSDEFLYHENLIEVLRHSLELEVPVLMPCGYEMSSLEPPLEDSPITEQIRRGVFSPCYSKPCCFCPQRLKEINIWGGSHHAAPIGGGDHIRPLGGIWFFFPYPGLKLLHYRQLGVAWVVARRANQRRDWCVDAKKLDRNLRDLEALSTEIIPEGPIRWFEQAPVGAPPVARLAPDPPTHVDGSGAVTHVSRRPIGRWFS